jgi:hypothetical protein
MKDTIVVVVVGQKGNGIAQVFNLACCYCDISTQVIFIQANHEPSAAPQKKINKIKSPNYIEYTYVYNSIPILTNKF